MRCPLGGVYSEPLQPAEALTPADASFKASGSTNAPVAS